ncbi:GNAT family N-acetyltransferase [Alkaliphilus crotonatoxidans]
MEVRVYQADEEMAEEISQLIASAAGEEIPQAAAMMYGRGDIVRERLKRGVEIIFYAASQEGMVGIIGALANKMTDPENDSLSVTTFYVKPQDGRAEIESQLLTQLIEYGKDKGMIKISVAVPGENIDRQVLMIRHLFKQEGYLRHARRKNHDLVLYGMIFE